MAFAGSSIPSEVGLQLLLAPLNSNIVVRAACGTVGIALPVYSTFKAIESKNQDEQHKCLVYWAAYGSFAIAERITDKLIHWVPLYYHMKFAFLVWLQLPAAYGATQMYTKYLRPFLLRHEAELDRLVGFLYSQMANFVARHQAELQFFKKILTGLFTAGNQVLGPLWRPAVRNVGRAIEGLAQQDEDSHSDHED